MSPESVSSLIHSKIFIELLLYAQSVLFWKQKATQSLSHGVYNLVGEITITQIITDQCIKTLLATCQIELFQTILSCYRIEIYIYILKIHS